MIKVLSKEELRKLMRVPTSLEQAKQILERNSLALDALLSMAGGEGTIFCSNDSPIFADAAYNLANSGHAFFFIPISLIKKDGQGYSILVISDKQDLSSCLQQNGPRQEFQLAIQELKNAVNAAKLATPQGKSDARKFNVEIDEKTADLIVRLISHERMHLSMFVKALYGNEVGSPERLNEAVKETRHKLDAFVHSLYAAMNKDVQKLKWI